MVMVARDASRWGVRQRYVWFDECSFAKCGMGQVLTVSGGRIVVASGGRGWQIGAVTIMVAMLMMVEVWRCREYAEACERD